MGIEAGIITAIATSVSIAVSAAASAAAAAVAATASIAVGVGGAAAAVGGAAAAAAAASPWTVGLTLGSMAIGGATAIAGGVMNYNQQNAQADAQKKAFEAGKLNDIQLAEYNANLAERQANEVDIDTAEREKRLRTEGERNISFQRALLGKSGAALYSGSPLAVLGHAAANNEMTVLDARREGNIRAENIRSQGQIYGYQGRVAGSQSFYKPSYAGSLLQGFGSAASAIGSGISSFAGIGTPPVTSAAPRSNDYLLPDLNLTKMYA